VCEQIGGSFKQATYAGFLFFPIVEYTGRLGMYVQNSLCTTCLAKPLILVFTSPLGWQTL